LLVTTLTFTNAAPQEIEMTKTYPAAAAVMAALRTKGFQPTYTPPEDGMDGEITVTETVTIQRCLYAGGYAVGRWIEAEQAQENYPVRATIPEILCEVSAALSA
jgi:hypothetical protein